MYDKLYSERKHNDETITSPWPDVEHDRWEGVLKGHIDNPLKRRGRPLPSGETTRTSFAALPRTANALS